MKKTIFLFIAIVVVMTVFVNYYQTVFEADQITISEKYRTCINQDNVQSCKDYLSYTRYSVSEVKKMATEQIKTLAEMRKEVSEKRDSIQAEKAMAIQQFIETK